jgi:phosphatidate phosphatase APP1
MLGQWRRSRSTAAPDALVLYYAYGCGAEAVLEGRVIDHQVLRTPTPLDSRRINLQRNLRLLLNKERRDFPVVVTLGRREWEVRTDVEGFFRIEMHALDDLSAGWHAVRVSAGVASATISLLLVPRTNTHGVISDFDDTLMVTEVNRWRRMLANTLLRNPLQRSVVPGMSSLYRSLAARNADPSSAPMFYVSASPRQFHMPLQAVLDHHDFPPGVLITKRVTNERNREPILDPKRYKLAHIHDILRRVPHVAFTLIGDDGEHDPEIFEEVRARNPDRIADIWIRRVHPDPRRLRRAEQKDVTELLRRHGLEFQSG